MSSVDARSRSARQRKTDVSITVVEDGSSWKERRIRPCSAFGFQDLADTQASTTKERSSERWQIFM